jgi:hypothetical protein
MTSLRTSFLGFLIFLLLGLSLGAAVPFVAYAQTTPPAETASGRTIDSNDGCSSWSTWAFSPTCWWQSFMSEIGSTFLTIGGGILVIAGFVFDKFLQYLVIDFQGTITNLNIFGGIQIAWQLFRDLANVAIIGVFVFVAIMTILGSAEYGAKRLVARVLLVAILINFSLLFTRFVVESTNFVSGQFARSMPGNAQEIGVAQSFLQAFGIHGVWSGTKALTDRAARETDSGWAALLYGLVGGIALLTIAGVLLYGAVMMGARAMLLIFMLITSSLAFASFLLPQWSDQAFIGWNNWWSNLLKAAMFGPILMVFLWIAMQIVSRASITGGAGEALGQLADDPTKLSSNAWQQLIFLMIGTGILFIGIRASSKFSAAIGTMSAARGIAGMAALLPIGFAARLGGLVGQQTIGRASYLASQRLLEAAQRQQAGGTAQKMLNFGSRQFMQGASANFNALNNSLSKQFSKEIGLRNSALLTGKNLKGFAGSEARKVEKATELGERMKVSDAEALSRAKKDPEFKKSEDTVGEKDSTLKTLVKQQTDTTASFQKTIQGLENELKKAQSTAATGNATAYSEAKDLERRIASERAEHQADMNKETSRIETARNELRTAQSGHEKLMEQKVRPQSADKVARAAIENSYTAALERVAGMGDMAERRANEAAKKAGETATNKRVRDVIGNMAQPTSVPPQQAIQQPSAPSAITHTEKHGGDIQKAA